MGDNTFRNIFWGCFVLLVIMAMVSVYTTVADAKEIPTTIMCDFSDIMDAEMEKMLYE